MGGSARSPVLRVPRALLWCLFLASLARYLAEHLDVLQSRIPGEVGWPHYAVTAPVGVVAPWVLLAAAALGGFGIARRFAARPALVAWLLGAAATFVVPAHILGLAGLVSGRSLFTPWAWALTACIAAAWAVRRQPARQAGVAEADVEVRGRDPLLPWLAFAALVVGAQLAHSVARTIRVGPRCWDGESYHLPVPLEWLGTHSLTVTMQRLLAAAGDVPWYFAHPGNVHLLMCAPLLLHWDLLAYLVQLPFLVLAVWSCHALARGAGASRLASALSALAFLSAPVIVEQASVPLVDLATSAFSLTALALLFRAADSGAVSSRELGLAGLAAGMALGSKTTALAHMGLLAVVAVSSRWLWRPPLAAGLKQVASFLALLLAPSAFWYLRSTVIVGNPIYPIGFGGTTAEAMSGDWERNWLGIRSAWEWAAVPFRDPLYFSESGFGALLVGLGVLGVIGGGVAALDGLRDGRISPQLRLALVTVVGLTLFFLVAARTPRFNLPLLALFAALAGPVVDALGDGWRRHAAGLLACLAATLTLTITIHQDGWDVAPPDSRSERLQRDIPAVPPAVDDLPPLVVFNDTHDDDGSRPSTYWLSGADHRHVVFESRSLPEDPTEFLRSVRALGANAIFLRIRKGTPEPPRYHTPALIPVARFEGSEYRSVIYRLR